MVSCSKVTWKALSELGVCFGEREGCRRVEEGLCSDFPYNGELVARALP